MPAFITDLTQSLDLDDALARAVLPHALVSALLAEENPALAAYHEQKYLEVLSRLRNTPRVSEEIERIYGVLGGEQV
jgi:capsule polysaccharide export protein KpsE/RkpR